MLMRVGTKDGGSGDFSNPTVLSDVFARVGGPDGLSTRGSRNHGRRFVEKGIFLSMF